MNLQEKIKINDIVKGFKLVNIKKIDDISSTMYEFNHIGSGCTLVYLENEDTNKCFSVGFRTVPEDSTGICHIIEHSVLCGSKKFPLKEPFVNLLKGSMATFLNAMTAYDWTMYPVASQNNKDFDNLISVYLDAVFDPLSIKDDKPFLQEGWHLEMNDVNDVPCYKGVVYNEMKGVMSDVDTQLFQETCSVIYKGTCYEYNSGGDPNVIPNLTFDYYKDFYKRHYHPSNALMYLYGEMNLLEKLDYIDKEYLSRYEKDQEEVIITKPNKVIKTDVEKYYEISETEDEKDNTYMSLSFGLTDFSNALEITAFSILNEALMGSNDSQLKKMLMDLKLGQNIISYVNDETIYPIYYIALQKTNKEEKERFYNSYIECIKRVIKEGIDKKSLLAVINNREFKNKEMDSGGTPKGLFFAFSLMQSYNYKVPFANYLEYTKYFDFYRKELNSGYFEKLLEKYIINSDYYALVTLLPSKTVGVEAQKKMDELMNHFKETMTLEEKQEVVRITKQLIEYQSKKDTKEELETLPKLELNDITLDVNTLPKEKTIINNVNVLKHKFNTNKIAYLKMYFDLQGIEFEELPYVTILTRLLLNLDTEKFSANDLQSYIKTYLGRFNFEQFVSSMSKDDCVLKFVLHASTLLENVSKINLVIDEVINKTIFDDEKILVILKQLQNNIRSNIISNGTQVALNYARMTTSKEGMVNAKNTGINLYHFVTDLINNYKTINVKEKLLSITKRIFSIDNLTVSISGDDEVLNELTKVVSELPINNNNVQKVLTFENEKRKDEALVIPSLVNYNGKALNLSDYGYTFNGKLLVLSHIINYDYLWPEVRVKGGAYGCSMRVFKNGDLGFGSFRDPNVTNTFNTYDAIYKYIANLELTEEDLETYIIGAIGGFDYPQSNNAEISSSDQRYLLNYSDELRKLYKKQMKEITIKDIKSYSELFMKVKESTFYTVGNENCIKDYNRFKDIKKL